MQEDGVYGGKGGRKEGSEGGKCRDEEIFFQLNIMTKKGKKKRLKTGRIK